MFLLSLEIRNTGDKTMNCYYIAQALNALVPDCAFGCGDTYDSIEWYSTNTQPLPTEDEVNAKVDELKSAEPFRLLREERNKLISETDWTQLKDIDLDIIRERNWKNYRQALRDLPAKSNPKLNEYGRLDMKSVSWPDKPSS